MSAALDYQITATLRKSERRVVYRAVDAAQRPVTLEVATVLPPDPREVARMENELRVAGALTTDAVIHPVAVGLHQGRPAIAREEAPGEGLDRLAPMSIERFLTVAIGAARALRELHALGLIHRDIKPENLVLDETTGQVRCRDLGLAIWQPREETPGAHPRLLEGTPAYMSPEQTGRMNRAVDQRSDLYSLGITCYELLTGALPFAAADPLQWVHWHVAQTARPLHEAAPAVPPVLSSIVGRLLAKNPEDRYQSASGLLHDLERCREQWRASGRIEPFPLGERDVSHRWLLPQRLYGREPELEALQGLFDRVSAGRGPVLALLSGQAGVGKSALVAELHAAIARQQGTFLSGKFDPYQRAIPYATVVQALRDFSLDLLSESDRTVADWRDRLRRAVDPHGRVLVELVPPLELILGKQPPVIELPPAEAQQRLAGAFRRLLGAIATPERPLVLFLDDLQWSDPASVALLEQIIGDENATHLLVIGAYRDNEVDGAHPLTAALARLGKREVTVERLALGPLSPAAVGDLVAQALNGDRRQVAALAELVHAKTAGNPFFVRQLLDTFHQEGLIAFDPRALVWRWDVARIAAHDITRNVAMLLAERLGRLPAATREVLRVGACIGTIWELGLVAAVLGRDETALAESLGQAVTEGLLIGRTAVFRFPHDHLRQAAYQDIPAAKAPALHREIARALLARTPPAELDAVLFDLVNQLARADVAIEDRVERERAAELSLRAGRRARRAVAHAAAVEYLAIAAAFARSSGDAGLIFAIDLELAESQLLSGHHELARPLLAELLGRAPDVIQRARVYRARQSVFQFTGEMGLAVADEVEALRAFGIDLPAQPTVEDVALSRQQIEALLARHPPETLADLPSLTDPRLLAALQVVTPSYFVDQRLFFVHVARMVSVLIEDGLSEDASYWFGNYALALSAFGDYRLSRRLAEAAYRIARRHPLTPHPAVATFLLGQISCWTDPLDRALELLRTAYRLGRESGAFEMPWMAACSQMVVELARGRSLEQLEELAGEFLPVLEQAGARDYHDLVLFQRQVVRRLRGQTRVHASDDQAGYDDDQFDARRFEATWTAGRVSTAACWYWVHRLRASVLFGEVEAALAEGERAASLLWASMGLLAQRDFVLYRGLSVAAALDGANDDPRRPAWLAELRAHEQQARLWAELNPTSFAHGHALLAAALARIDGRLAEAMALHERSITGARDGGFTLDEALAWEMAARLHPAGGAVATVYLSEARTCYLRCDAQAKVRQLDRAHPALTDASRPLTSRGTYSGRADEIDLLSVAKAGQAISEETTVDRVTTRLMELVLVQGGASRGLLIVRQGETLTVAAEAGADRVGSASPGTAGDPPPLQADAAPLSVVQLASRTGEAVVLEDATREPRHAADPYVLAARPRSVLCLPIRRQARVVALLYLENRAAVGAFTRPRLQVLELLAAQAAISLQNAALLERSLEAVRLREEFLSVASHELNTPLAGLTLSVQVLREKAQARVPPEAYGQLTELIDRQARRLTRLVDELLDVTRLQSKQLALRLEPVDLGALVGEVTRRVQPQLERARCKLALALEPVPVRADRGRLEQVLSNLLSNAMKFGAGRPVEVQVDREGRLARLAVTDHGIGIDLASHQRLFQRFERGVSASHYGGLGLGLYICRQIVEAHDGTIAVESRPGHGANFTVLLPIHDPPGPQEAPEETPKESP